MSQPVACNFCGSDETTFLHTLRDVRRRLPGEYRLVSCNRCGLQYLNPQPTAQDLEALYSKDYHCFIQAVDDQPGWITRWAQKYGLKRRIRTVTRLIPSGCILDVGCGTGNFLNEMKQSGGWQVYGVEPSQAAVDYARQRFGIEVFTGTLLDANFAPESFQAATMWDVLEHTHNPQAYLVEIYRLLSPGGWVVLKSPDPCSWEARTFGPSWVGFEAPQHLFGFPPEVLVRKLDELGYRNIQIAALGGDYATFLTSLSLWLEARQQMRLSRMAQSLASSTIARVVSAPVFAAMRKLGAGSSRVYLAQKPI